MSTAVSALSIASVWNRW